MNISCFGINSNLINTSEQTRIIDYLKNKLYEIGENISLISYFDNTLENVKNYITNKFDVIFVIGTNNSVYNYNIKDNLCRVFNDQLNNFEETYSCLNKYCNRYNIVFSMQEENEVKLPSKSIPLCSIDYYLNGFMYKWNNTYIMYLPDNFEFVIQCFNSNILPLLNDIVDYTNQQKMVLKCFGILEKDIRSLISDYLNLDNIFIQIKTDGLDSTIYIRYENSSKIQDIISDICNKLNKFIYATDDTSIYKLAIDLLNLQKKTITVAETLTLGNIIKELTLLSNDRLENTYVFNNYNTILKQIPIEKKIVDRYGKYSVEVVYELTNHMLSLSQADIAIFTLGDINNPNICYIAIGDVEGIHVYKNNIHTTHDDMIRNLSKTAMFYLIKKLKQNDLHFNRNCV